jgi:hypothetical protein
MHNVDQQVDSNDHGSCVLGGAAHAHRLHQGCSALQASLEATPTAWQDRALRSRPDRQRTEVKTCPIVLASHRGQPSPTICRCAGSNEAPQASMGKVLPEEPATECNGCKNDHNPNECRPVCLSATANLGKIVVRFHVLTSCRSAHQRTFLTPLRRLRAALPGRSVSASNCCPGHDCILPDRNPQVCRIERS